MSKIDWLYVLLGAAAVVGVISFLAWQLGSIFEEYFRVKRRRQFALDLLQAVKHSQPTWEELVDIASSRGVEQAVVYWMIRDLLREILTGRSSDLEPHRKELEAYLAKYRELEPFEGLPNEIRIHLERIKEQLQGKPQLLEPLTAQIRELVRVNERERRQQKYYTVGGFIVGFVGLLLAAYSYFFPFSSPPAPRGEASPQGPTESGQRK